MGCALAVAPQIVQRGNEVRHPSRTPADDFLGCTARISGVPVLADPGAFRILNLTRPACPNAKEDLEEVLKTNGLAWFRYTAANYIVPVRDFAPAPFRPPRLSWREVDVTVTSVFIDSGREVSELERQTIVAPILRLTRGAPITAPARGNAEGVAKLDYQIRLYEAPLARGSAPAVIAIVGGLNDVGRLVYGERGLGGYRPLWDSPLFSSWMLRLGFSDLDGDDIPEILLSAAAGINGEFTTLVAFDRQGNEMTRQVECVSEIAPGLIDQGIACPITGTKMELVSSGRTKDILVWTTDSSEARRLVLRGGRFQ